MDKFFCTKDSPVVQVKQGKLRGFFFDGVYRFLGIPYAKAARFHMPEAPDAWEGIRNALAYGKICPILNAPNPDDEIVVPHRFWPESEHCQNLNVWTDTLDPDAKKPVMVWFHGGGFSSGSAIEHVAYEGDNLEKYDGIVSVSVNHRMNAFGHLDLSAYGEEYKNSVNVGIADLVAALKWVKENIAEFGGDPENVTIFGQSGGGQKVTSMGQVPAAAGLFQKAIVMSGVAFPGMFDGVADPKYFAEKLLSVLEIRPEEIKKLEKLNYQLFIRAVNKTCRLIEKEGLRSFWAPVANDWFPGWPEDIGFSEHYKSVPTMVGTMLSEMGSNDGIGNKEALTEEERTALVRNYVGDDEKADRLIELFKKAYPGKNIVYAIGADCMCRPTSREYCLQKAREGSAPVFNYTLASIFDYDGGRAPWHCADIPFAFHNSAVVPFAFSIPYRERLEKEINGAFVSFAKCGDPNHGALAPWKAVEPERLHTMVFDEKSECRTEYDTAFVQYKDQIKPMRMGMRPTPPEDEESDRAWLY